MKFQRISKERACPVCKNVDVYRIKRTGLHVKVVCRLLNLRPHWCPDCDTFFLGPKVSGSRRTVGPYPLPGRTEKTANQPQAGSLPH